MSSVDVLVRPSSTAPSHLSLDDAVRDHEQIATAVKTPAKAYSLSIGYLRAFITVLVVAHHAVLAYHPFAPPAPMSLGTEPRW
jgi:hypothetical protein